MTRMSWWRGRSRSRVRSGHEPRTTCTCCACLSGSRAPGSSGGTRRPHQDRTTRTAHTHAGPRCRTGIDCPGRSPRNQARRSGHSVRPRGIPACWASADREGCAGRMARAAAAVRPADAIRDRASRLDSRAAGTCDQTWIAPGARLPCAPSSMAVMNDMTREIATPVPRSWPRRSPALVWRTECADNYRRPRGPCRVALAA